MRLEPKKHNPINHQCLHKDIGKINSLSCNVLLQVWMLDTFASTRIKTVDVSKTPFIRDYFNFLSNPVNACQVTNMTGRQNKFSIGTSIIADLIFGT